MVFRINKGWSEKIKSALSPSSSELPDMLYGAMLRVEAESKRIVYLGHEQGHLNYLTGKLGISITTNSGWDGNVAYGVVGTNLEYAPTHEFGAVIHQDNRTIKVPARPYLIPAFESKKHEVKKVVLEKLDEIIRGV